MAATQCWTCGAPAEYRHRRHGVALCGTACRQRADDAAPVPVDAGAPGVRALARHVPELCGAGGRWRDGAHVVLPRAIGAALERIGPQTTMPPLSLPPIPSPESTYLDTKEVPADIIRLVYMYLPFDILVDRATNAYRDPVAAVRAYEVLTVKIAALPLGEVVDLGDYGVDVKLLFSVLLMALSKSDRNTFNLAAHLIAIAHLRSKFKDVRNTWRAEQLMRPPYAPDDPSYGLEALHTFQRLAPYKLTLDYYGLCMPAAGQLLWFEAQRQDTWYWSQIDADKDLNIVYMVLLADRTPRMALIIGISRIIHALASVQLADWLVRNKAVYHNNPDYLDPIPGDMRDNIVDYMASTYLGYIESSEIIDRAIHGDEGVNSAANLTRVVTKGIYLSYRHAETEFTRAYYLDIRDKYTATALRQRFGASPLRFLPVQDLAEPPSLQSSDASALAAAAAAPPPAGAGTSSATAASALPPDAGASTMHDVDARIGAALQRIGPKSGRKRPGTLAAARASEGPVMSSSSGLPPRTGDSDGDDDGSSDDSSSSSSSSYTPVHRPLVPAPLSGTQIETVAAVTWFVWEEFFRPAGYKLFSIATDPDTADVASVIVATFVMRLHDQSDVAVAALRTESLVYIIMELQKMSATPDKRETILMDFAESFGLGKIANDAVAGGADTFPAAAVDAYEQARRDYVRKHYRQYLRDVIVNGANAAPMMPYVAASLIYNPELSEQAKDVDQVIRDGLEGIINPASFIARGAKRSTLLSMACAAFIYDYSRRYMLEDWSPSDPPAQLTAVNFNTILTLKPHVPETSF